MTRLLSPGRSLVFGLLPTAMVLAALQPLNWDARLNDGIAAIQAGNSAEAVQILSPLLEQAKAFPREDPRLAESTMALAVAYQYNSQFDQAEPLYLEAVQLLGAGGEKSGSMLALAFENLGQLRLGQGRWQEAKDFLGKARDLYSKIGKPDDRRVANVDRLLGETCLGQGQIAEAVVLIEHAVDALRQALDVAPSTLAAGLRSLATAYTVQGRYPEAEAPLEESIRLTRGTSQTQLDMADGILALGHLCLLERDTARAMPLLQKAVHIFEAHDDSHLSSALSELGSAALQEGKYAMAKEYLGRALDINQKLLGWDRLSIAMVQGALAEAYFGERNYGQAAALIQQAIATDRAAVGGTHFTMAKLLLIEATIEAKQRRALEAETHYRQALDIYRRTFAANHPDLMKAQREYAQFVNNK